MDSTAETNSLLRELLASNAAFLAAHQKALDSQAKEIEQLKKAASESPQVNDPYSGVAQYRALEALASMLDTFVYDEENGQTFEAWFDRYSGVIEVGAANLDDKGKIELVLMKLDPSANALYRNSIAPKAPADFSDTTDKLKALFRKKISLLRTRWNCLQMQRRPDEDIAAYGARVNKETEDFMLSKLTSEQFKVLIFVLGMRDAQDNSVRTRLLNLQDKGDEKTVTLQSIVVTSVTSWDTKRTTANLLRLRPSNHLYIGK